MSMQDYGLLSAPSSHDHFPSAFMQGYHPHQGYDHERYPPASQPPLDRYIQPMHADVPSSVARHSYLPSDRRASDPTSRPTYIRHSVPPATYHPSFEYMHNPLAHSALLHSSRSAAPPATHTAGMRSVVGFDPRPPHAGWTPKEEVDDDEQTRELLAGGGGDGRSPADSHLSLMHSPVETRDESNSPAQPAQQSAPPHTSKTYSFVSLPGNAVRKRPRRRYDEIERLYSCAWPDCTKAYGTLNHLNAHVSMQRHGPKRSPAEFKELRKQWRQQKKQDFSAHSPAGNTSHATAIPVGAGATPTSDPPPHLQRRRRATEPSIPLSDRGDGSHGIEQQDAVGSHLTHHAAVHRLSLGDLRYPPPHPPSSDDEGTVLGPSPTSTSSDGLAYWQQETSPISPVMESGHHVPHHHHAQQQQQQQQQQSRASGLHSHHYPVGIDSSPPPAPASGAMSPSTVVGSAGVGGGGLSSSSPMNRLPPDSTLLTPLPGYHPHHPPSPPPMSRLGPGSTLLQPLHTSTLATLSPPPQQQQQHPRSPESVNATPRGYDEYRQHQHRHHPEGGRST